MWLLSTDRAELKYFASPKQVLPRFPSEGSESARGYAILSHVWGENEQTFQDVRALATRCAQSGENPRDLASEKIRRACELAEREGYDWIWIDTCCIDKTSSAELSEAINSMFRYHSLAGECFAYLEDVPGDEPDFIPEDQFMKSKWHTRGWTLQELIAPHIVSFVSASWTVIGDKWFSSGLVEEATGVPVNVLQDPARMKEFSIAQCMSWSSRRVTTREEDEAYCLLGIFDINMPTLYGEGRKAFRRLQEEIMRQSPDTTLFAWGLRCTWDELFHLRVQDPADCNDPDYHLFATSPSLFSKCSAIRFVNPTRTCLGQSPDEERHDGYITFTSTPHGVLTVIPSMTHQQQILGHLGWVENGRFLLSILQSLPTDNSLSKDSLYMVGVPLLGVGEIHFPRVVYASSALNDTMHQRSAQVEWRRGYLAYEHAATKVTTKAELVLGSASHIRKRRGALIGPFQFDPRQLGTMGMELLDKDSRLPSPGVRWNGEPPVLLTLQWTRLSVVQTTVIRLGVCTESSSSAKKGHHWAQVVKGGLNDVLQRDSEHDCVCDHISDWPDLSRKFGHSANSELGTVLHQLTLSFTRSEFKPKERLMMRLDWKVVNDYENDCYVLADDDTSDQLRSAQSASDECPDSGDDLAPSTTGEHSDDNDQ